MKKYIIAGCLASIVSMPAWAHAPFLDCNKNGETIHCTGGFSDGSSAFGVHITVLSYDEKVLFQGRLNEESTIDFQAPEGEFYVKFDAGPGHETEVDYTDILPAEEQPKE